MGMVRRGRKPAFWALTVVMVLAVLAHVPLVFVGTGDYDAVTLYRRGRTVITAGRSSPPTLAYWHNDNWRPFGKPQGRYLFCIGWVSYRVGRQPPIGDVVARLDSDHPDDIVYALHCLIRIPNAGCRERLVFFLSDTRYAIRTTAAQALAEIGDPRGIATLEADAKSTDVATANVAHNILSLYRPLGDK